MSSLRWSLLSAAALAVAFVVAPSLSRAAAPAAAPAASPEGSGMWLDITDDATIRPFPGLHVSDDDLADLIRRVKATKWPDKEVVADDTQGVQLATMKKLAEYWGSSYDWRKFEKRLDAIPMFVTTIDGVDIQFIHVKSKNKNALPLIITHGWPGSIVEQLKVIDPLVNPTAHGGKASDAFDVVIPSLPGYGLSGKPTALGWDPQHIARAWTILMKRLGYKHFVAQGGDWGNAVSEQMAVQAPPELLGISTNMAATVPDDIAKLLSAGAPPPASLSADEKKAYEQLDDFYKHGLGYAQEMTGRPQTLYALADSPVGLAAWMIDHDIRSYRLIRRVFDGESEGLSKDDILDNVSFYWFTNTAVSSARLYWESKLPFFEPKKIQIPVAVSAFPDEIYQAPESWAKAAYPKLIHYNRLAKGGHFAAWEQPDAFVTELRESFRPLRKK
ncbi:epoxide hydrolase family protein [Luteibacter pinisoli]|nr:epoxide hydrolase family protein [Luteibacter pinisoli]